MTITIVTCWLHHHELAEDYAAALVPELRPGDEVIVVDNGNAPDLPDLPDAMFLAPELQLQVVEEDGRTHGQVLERKSENLGFVKGSNLGLEHATCDAVLFLNNDVALGQRGWLQPIRDALEPGVLVGRVRHDRHAWVDGIPMPYLDGWCLAGMRVDLDDLGGFDETLEEPAYYSDNLICLEARAQGLTLREVTVGLHHKESATSRPSVNPEVRRVTLANQARYVARARDLLVAT